MRIEGFAEAESELLSYPDGTVIRPWLELPHGIEYKKDLMTNAKRWWWRDDELLASYTNKNLKRITSHEWRGTAPSSVGCCA